MTGSLVASESTDNSGVGPKDDGKQRILVAFGQNGRCEVLATSGALVEHEDSEQAVPWNDVFGVENDPKYGLWVWEGEPFYESDGSRDYPDATPNWDNGVWREPNADEWDAIMAQKAPWPKTSDAPGEDREP